MNLETPEGNLTIDDDELKFVPSDGGAEQRIALTKSVPDYRYERGVYGFGTLVIGDHVIVIRNDQAPVIVEELRKPRGTKAKKSADTVKTDSDGATSK